MPLAKMAATFVANRSSAPRHWAGAPDCRVRPATASGGTSEMAMATPGRVSEISGRASATEPTYPVARAAARSTIRGVTRAATWLFVAASTG